MKQHFLNDFTVPEKRLEKVTDVVTLHLLSDGKSVEFDSWHCGGRVFSKLGLRQGERAVILSVKMTYASNSTKAPVKLCLQNLFQPRKGTSKHPDVTGHVAFHVPANQASVVSKVHQTIYEPNLRNLGVDILPFAGLEDSISDARSTVVLEEGDIGSLSASSMDRGSAYELFRQSDPILVFMLTHSQAWHNNELGPQDITYLKSAGVYKVKRPALEQARSFFKRAIFPLFCYTYPHHEMTLVCESDIEPLNDGFAIVVLVLEMEYMVVSAVSTAITMTSKHFI